ncbi:hypothetical protein [Aestuariimicrobium kwangyangense]|uniref:hypothetical protein n=1 Tax=Aestuariimicrobium kwangyangense TaxID=396389 RepID=UPI0003B5B1E9|nr:hypothetical protein [Aestuariimicrobium kwangyangense]
MRTGRRVSLLGLVVVLAALLAAGWITQWTKQDPPVEQLTARPDQEVVINADGQSVRFMELTVGQLYSDGRRAQATGARYLLVTVRLTTPRQRSMISFDCEAQQGGDKYRPIGLGRTNFPEPGQRTSSAIAFEFDPDRAAELRIVCKESTTIIFRDSTVTFDPGLGRESGRALLRASSGRVVEEVDATTEPIRP